MIISSHTITVCGVSNILGTTRVSNMLGTFYIKEICLILFDFISLYSILESYVDCRRTYFLPSMKMCHLNFQIDAELLSTNNAKGKSHLYNTRHNVHLTTTNT